jgi:uncharacterized membrane protein YkvA (DUF1232 family)
LKDPAAARELEKDALSKIREHSEALGDALDDLLTLIRLIRAYATGDYREIPVRTIAAAAAAVAYFVMPIDAIPDFIPVAGYIDDVAVILLVVDAISRNLDDFREWETNGPKGGGSGPRAGAGSKKPTARKASTTRSGTSSRKPAASKRSGATARTRTNAGARGAAGKSDTAASRGRAKAARPSADTKRGSAKRRVAPSKRS